LRLGRPEYPPPGLDELAARTRETYNGPLTIGEDLLRFHIGDQVTVIPLFTEY
jgi:ribonuclease Z